MIPLILESPNKIKKLSSFLPRGQYVVMASCGHIRKLGDTHDGMGFDANSDALDCIDYVEESGKRKIIAAMKQKCKGAAKIFLATDPDREGEAIAWHIMQVLGPKRDYYRIRFHSLTAPAVLDALAHPTRLDDNLVWAQQTRQLMDKWIGFRVSPQCWTLQAKSAGRVQSPALKLLVRREREIRDFQPVTYVTLGANFVFMLESEKKSGKKSESALLHQYRDMAPPLHFVSSEAAMAALRTIEQQCRTWVLNCTETETLTFAPPPYTTLTMLQDCHTKLKVNPERGMALLQKLYECGHITYHRTDSVVLSPEGVFGARDAVEKSHPHLLSAAPRNYTTRSTSAQEAHEAIRPTHFDFLDTHMQDADDPLLAKMYRLIYLRTLATQCAPRANALFTSLYTSPEEPRVSFRATESVVKSLGWQSLYNVNADVVKIKPTAAKKDQKVLLDEFTLHTQDTAPPPHFNSSTLIQTMESMGIGRPSTYASIVAKLVGNKYMVENDKTRRLHPTALGGTLVDFLEQRYESHFMNLAYTQQMESQLDAIAAGTADWRAVMTSFLRDFPKAT
jgi:DNA topoisomerase-1